MKIGIQLYSVRQSMATNPVKTIDQVVQQGYNYLEAANHNALEDFGVGFGLAAADLKELLDKRRASMVSAHVSPLNPDNIGSVLEYNKVIGTKFLVLPMAFYKDRQAALDMAALLNQLGEACADAGMELCYHNHFHEFQAIDGEIVFDTLMDNTDPELVKIELDTYWAMRGGQNPIVVLKKYGKRVRLIHQKDYPYGHEDKMNLLDRVGGDVITMETFNSVVNPDAFVEIGQGVMPIQDIIYTAGEYCDVDYIILEQDHTKYGEMESIKRSMDSFRRFSGVSWE